MILWFYMPLEANKTASYGMCPDFRKATPVFIMPS